MGAVSATWPDAVRRLAATFQKDPVRVTIGSDDLTANARVAQGRYPPSILLLSTDLSVILSRRGLR